MSQYEEMIDGRTLVRSFPGARHERICALLHARVEAGLAANAAARLLGPREAVALSERMVFRPDLALVTAATGKVWLVVEIIDSADHRPDTVLKKGIYEDFKVPAGLDGGSALRQCGDVPFHSARAGAEGHSGRTGDP